MTKTSTQKPTMRNWVFGDHFYIKRYCYVYTERIRSCLGWICSKILQPKGFPLSKIKILLDFPYKYGQWSRISSQMENLAFLRPEPVTKLYFYFELCEAVPESFNIHLMMISIKVCSEIDGFVTYVSGIVTSYGSCWRGKTAPILLNI